MPDPERTPLDVTAVIIAYKSEDRIVEAVEAQEAALAHLDAETIVVDNASRDGTADLARSVVTRGRVVVNEENLGYGYAANQGIALARGRATIILNDDAQLTANAVDRMLEVLNGDDDIALVGPRIVDEDGNPMPSARATFPGLGEEMKLIGDSIRRRNTNYSYPTRDTSPMDVAWLVGACIMGRTDVLRATGGFNPAFFLYVEDIDLCRRMRALGYRVVTVPDATCSHTGSVSTSAAFGVDARIQRRTDAREIFYRIWYPRVVRSLIHLRRAVGVKNQPWRLRYHIPKLLRDGGSLSRHRFPPPLEKPE